MSMIAQTPPAVPTAAVLNQADEVVVCELVKQDSPTLRSVFDKVYRPQKLRHASPSTVLQYRINLDRFDRMLGRPAVLTDLNDNTIADLMAYTIQQGRKPRTANKVRDNLLAFWRFCARKGIVKEWPDVEPVHEPERIPEAWTEQQLRQLFASASHETFVYGGVLGCDWWLALFSILWDTGERIRAILQIEWEQIDLQGRWLKVLAEQRKGRQQDMLFRLHPDTIKRLEKIRKPERDKVFPWPFNLSLIYHHLNRIQKRAGLPTNRFSKFHRIRKSVASHAKAAGMDATHLLGHSSPRVTKAYIDPRICQTKHASDVLFRPADSPPPPDELIAPLVAEFLQSLLAETTVSRDVIDRRAFKLRWMLGAKLETLTLRELCPKRAAAQLADLESGRRKPKTIDDYRQALVSFCRWLIARKGAPEVAVRMVAELDGYCNREVVREARGGVS
jgi:site-specific recombinase XerD